MKRNGFRDEDIILILPDNLGCNPRNNEGQRVRCGSLNDLAPDEYIDSRVDYKDMDISSTMFLHLLNNQWPNNTPFNRQLNLHPSSKLVIYLSGHGGD